MQPHPPAIHPSERGAGSSALPRPPAPILKYRVASKHRELGSFASKLPYDARAIDDRQKSRRTPAMTRLSNLAYHSKYHDTRKAMPDITLFFLQASRAIRPAWALQELGLDYQIEFSERQDKVKAAPPEFKQKSGNPLGKFPTLKDGDLLVHESGAIVE